MARLLMLTRAFMADHQAVQAFLRAPQREGLFMDYAERERRRLAAAQDQATEAAKSGMKAPGADMVAIFSIAGFEVADIFAEWARRWEAANPDFDIEVHAPEELDWLEGLGPPFRLDDFESPEHYGARVARAVLKLIKEV